MKIGISLLAFVTLCGMTSKGGCSDPSIASLNDTIGAEGAGGNFEIQGNVDDHNVLINNALENDSPSLPSAPTPPTIPSEQPPPPPFTLPTE